MKIFAAKQERLWRPVSRKRNKPCWGVLGEPTGLSSTSCASTGSLFDWQPELAWKGCHQGRQLSHAPEKADSSTLFNPTKVGSKKAHVEKTQVSPVFLLLAQFMRLYLVACVLPHTPKDGVARISSPNSCAATRNLIHVGSVAPLWRTLIQAALPTMLLRLQQPVSPVRLPKQVSSLKVIKGTEAKANNPEVNQQLRLMWCPD